ncbi:MarR family winged helix-turn-helix transcriptional regulator [Micrococcus sp.]|uniref:MarR family winged helix-turn-helix transcriptional regulator n=1 Tax=Micrococcus sp. TaxID=1271 RepID=UPI002A908783|nr:MarR family transcriptional regulator [Micrococcus sp.]MDY6055098.1 MarR family transcriptional regulator [Micrococcus sp.]
MTSCSTPHPDPARPGRTGPEAAADTDAPEPDTWYGTATPAHRAADTAHLAWRAYFEATQLLTDRLERGLKESCWMSLADYHVLLLLVESDEGRLRMGELASRMVFSPSRLTYQVRSLMERGLVERHPTATDRRGAEAVITDAGRAAFRQASRHHGSQVDEFFLHDLDPEEARVLTRVFSRLGRRLDGSA